jgi:hypothetical protein
MKIKINLLFVLPFFVLACTEESMPDAELDSMVKDTTPQQPIVQVSDDVRFVFSEGFVPSDFEMSDWIGIYVDENGMYCKSTQATIKAVHDMWNDDENNLDATIIEDESKIPSVFLFSGITVPENFRVKSFNNIPNRILIGNSTQLGDYTLKADGEVTPENQLPLTYRLTIMGSKNGKEIEQIIVDHEFLDDAMTAILWIGDLDADDIPDMIIDMSHKYSYSAPALFLSSQADDGDILKLVAECESDFGGC